MPRRLKTQAELARQREIDVRDLYAFSRRLAVAFDVSDIHSAIEDHLASAVERKVVLFASAREASTSTGRHAGVLVPQNVRDTVASIASGSLSPAAGLTLTGERGEVWLVQAVSPKSLEFGVIAINFGHVTEDRANDMRVRVGAVLADATATLERLGVAHAISEARMRAQTDQLREALIGSVSHELRTPLASIMGAATVLGGVPALAGDPKLKALIHDVHDEALRLNHDIQNLLDASRISSEGVKPHNEWADVSDIINSAIERCRNRIGKRRLVFDISTGSAAGPYRSGAGAAGAGADLRQRCEVFAVGFHHHDHGAHRSPAHDNQRRGPRRRTDRPGEGADVGSLLPRRASRCHHQGSGLGLWIASRLLPRTAATSPPTARAREKAPPFKSNCRSHLRP